MLGLMLIRPLLIGVAMMSTLARSAGRDRADARTQGRDRAPS